MAPADENPLPDEEELRVLQSMGWGADGMAAAAVTDADDGLVIEEAGEAGAAFHPIPEAPKS